MSIYDIYRPSYAVQLEEENRQLRAENERLRAALRLLAYQADQHPLKIAEISQEVLLDLLARDKCR